MKLETYLSLKDLSQAAFAELIGESQPEVSRYVTGRRRPTLETLMRIQTVTKGEVRAEDFFPPVQERSSPPHAGARSAPRARAAS